MFFKIVALKSFTNFTNIWQTSVSKSFFDKIAGPQKCSFIKKTLIQVLSCEIFEILVKGA